MKSSIKIDFVDRGSGKGIEPVIRVEIKKSEDPRDTLISHLFQSLGSESYLQIEYSNHKHISTPDGLPDMEKTVLLFKPDPSGREIEEINKVFSSKLIAEVDKMINEGNGGNVVDLLKEIQDNPEKIATLFG
jgi:hypothetical protein